MVPEIDMDPLNSFSLKPTAEWTALDCEEEEEENIMEDRRPKDEVDVGLSDESVAVIGMLTVALVVVGVDNSERAPFRNEEEEEAV